jgi:mono/diheme cytochrome c family protein
MAPVASAAAGAMAKNPVAASDGAKVYATNCASCHQATGQGVADTFPPLAGNPAVTGDATKVIGFVKNGLNGKIEVKGHTYNGMMPAWGQQLSDGDIAAVVTYIRSSWGNKASAVTADQVKAVTK